MKDHLIKNHLMTDHLMKDHLMKNHLMKDHLMTDHLLTDHMMKDHQMTHYLITDRLMKDQADVRHSRREISPMEDCVDERPPSRQLDYALFTKFRTTFYETVLYTRKGPPHPEPFRRNPPLLRT